MRINKQDTQGTKPLLGKGELGYDDYAAGGDAGRVYVGTSVENVALAKKSEVDSKLESSLYTAADVLAKIKTVDGSGSGLDADLLDGMNSSTGNTANTIVARDASGNFTAGTITANLTGNASTATTLQTGRLINSTSFNGGSDITTAKWGTSRNITIGNTTKAVDGSADMSWSIAEMGVAASGHDHNGMLYRGNTTDFNTSLTEGTYNLASATSITNAPYTGAIYGTLVVYVNDGTTHNNSTNNIQQEFNDINGKKFTRSKYNANAWTTWLEVTKYVTNVTAGSGVVVSGTAGTAWTPTISLANVGTAGTYRSVTTDAQGRVTAGTNPTTLAGYGITDATSSSHVGATGTAHGNATTSVAGFMSNTDKTKLDGIATGANNYVHPTSGVTSGSYAKVTVDANGHVTAGLVPTMEDIPDAAFKKSVRCATTGNLVATYASNVLTMSAVGVTVIDGITVALNDRILVKDQASTAHNGIYRVSTLGTASVATVFTRTADADTSSEIAGAIVNVDSGTVNGGIAYTANFKTTDTLGTTGMPFYKLMYENGSWNINANTATTLQTARLIGGVSFNGSADITLPGVNTTGNQNTTGSAATLTTTRTFSATGDVTATAQNFNGSANVALPMTLANSGVTAGTYSKVTVDAKGRVTAGLTQTMEDIPDATFKRSVKCATTANITLSGTQTIDGIAVVAGDRVLVKEQSTASQNGIYVVAAGAWTRALDADTSSKIASALVAVDSGTLLGGKLFDNDFKTTDTLSTTALTWNTNLDDGSLLTAGSTAIGMVKYNGTTAAAGQFDGGTTTPTGTTRLNYGGNLYPTNINLTGSADTTTASSHVFVETGSDGFVRPKTLANFKTEMFASPTLVTPNIGIATGTSFNSITGLSSTAPAMNGTAAVGTGVTVARADHVHPTDTSRAPLASPVFTGTPSLPTGTTGVTQAVGDNSTKLATTAFVKNSPSSKGFEMLTANRTLTIADIDKVFFIGASGLTITFPDSTTLPAGSKFTILGSGGMTASTFTGSTFVNNTGDTFTTSEGYNFDMYAIPDANQYRAAQTSNFTGGGVSSLASSGYQKLPSGLIIQWGTTSSIPGNGNLVVAFPISFPNSCFTIQAGGTKDFKSTSGILQGALNVIVLTNSQFTISNDNENQPARWLAIGN